MSTSTSKKGRKNGGSSAPKEEEFEPGSWECTVCTYRNNFEAFKCQMCDTRKGTSTRKPRLNPNVVLQQTLVQNLAIQQTLGEKSAQRRQKNNEFCDSPESSTANQQQTVRSQMSNKLLTNKMNAKLFRRRPIPFRDALVVRSTAKKRQISVNGLAFTITEFKPRISPRGRKKLSATTN